MNEGLKVSQILIVHFGLTYGGSTRNAIDDAVSLQNQGYIVGFASEGGPLLTELEQNSIQFHRLYFVNPEVYPRWIRYLLGIPISTILLLYFVLQQKYNFLYVQHRQSGIPCTVVAWVTKATYIFISVNELGRLSQGRLFTPLGNHIIAVSNQVKQNIIDYFGVADQKITVISNAVNIDVKRADEDEICTFNNRFSIATQAQVVACVAMLVEVKGHDILLSAWKQVVSKFPQAMLLLTGDGPLKERLQAQSVALDITQNVRFLGFVDDISVVYSRALFVVLPSRSEGLPLSILEAFSYGLSAVATTVSGIPEIVLHEKTGLLVEPENPDQLAQTIIHLLSHDSLRQEMGDAGRHLVAQKYSRQVRETALRDYFENL